MVCVDSELNTPPPTMPEPAEPVVETFTQVFAGECADIAQRRRNLLGDSAGRLPEGGPPTVENGFVGLALSGGGIRSAAFSLGVLQALGNRDLIKRFDYLSTVSGGGYIGTTLSIGLSEGRGFPFGRGSTEAGETPITRHIRDNTRYLFPNGFSSIVTALVVYLRGLAMNLLVVLPVMLASAAVMVFFTPTMDHLKGAKWPGKILGILPDRFDWSVTIIVFILGVIVWIGYAIAASIRLTPNAKRREFSVAIFACILIGLAILPIIEVHTLLLKALYLPSDTAAASPGAGGGGFTVGFGWLTHLVAFLAPVAALPFVRRIAEQAVTEVTGTWGGFLKILASRALLLLLAAAAPAILWLCMMHLAFWATVDIARGWPAAPGFLAAMFGWGQSWLQTLPDPWCHLGGALVYLLAALAILVSWLSLSVNANSLHQLYRDRLGRTFLVKEPPVDDASDPEPGIAFMDDHKLSALAPDRGPYHLINAALNVPGSAYANRRGRNADFFVFSRRFVGSDLTGYVSTPCAEKAVYLLTTGTAMAISGAAAAPNMGMASVQPLSPTIALFNVRLGRWLLHPRKIAEEARDAMAKKRRRPRAASQRKRPSYGAKPGPWYLLQEAFSKTGFDFGKTADEALSTKQEFVFLTDGGHIENLGIYELLKRRCRVIVAIDGEADPDLRGASLTQLERFARIDLGTRIIIDWGAIADRTRDTSQRVRDRTVRTEAGPHVALGLIDYPPPSGVGAREVGVLVYVKASLSGDEASYVMAYKARNPSFPHESTADQFFSEEQFEVYRALGEHIVKRFLDQSDRACCHYFHRTEIRAILHQALGIF
ncbi:patatin-like phospholipase family protein [Methylobacterium aerolatum]|uniref:PNPLA domain-containing protein n=1 Tax=Methylobacterium aerolatum TaxID=418708 RepID=A0ABU0I5E5_9HYPH|nr:patatin-like phospholipase family protein [Methylobacterium aerolatum]MDQ0449248.1 hypothetical protein [Methylobacterium aerolatum]GJD35432.1 hypothetical protein FMGBMHLM_2342 [Methylobacterium aerolatum]